MVLTQRKSLIVSVAVEWVSIPLWFSRNTIVILGEPHSS